MTAGSRLQKALRYRYDVGQQAQRSVWRQPDLISWDQWIEARFWEIIASGEEQRLLLTLSQCDWLWEQTVRSSAAGAALLQPEVAARSAADAWRLLQEWQLDVTDRAFGGAAETRTFAAWARQFEARCRVHGWVDAARLTGCVLEGYRSGALSCPQRLILAGFDELTPLRKALLEIMAGLGCAITVLDESTANSKNVQFSARDSAHELEVCARWAAARLREVPEQQIGIVIPNLGARLESVQRTLDRELNPVVLIELQEPGTRLHNLSLGHPLSHYATVHDALSLFKFASAGLIASELGKLLRSPYVGGGDAEDSGAQFDVFLRQRNLTWISPHLLAEEVGRCHIVTEHLQLAESVLRWKREHDKALVPSAWIEPLRALLKGAQWPGDRSLNSEEHQEVERLHTLIGVLAELDRFNISLNLSEVVNTLRQQAATTLFQYQSGYAPVQVMGMLEASGHQFDALWVTGMVEGEWPAPAHPSPWLPNSLQRELGLPHATPDRELAFARTVTRRLAASAAEVVFSYPQQEQDRAQRVSPLVAGFGVLEEQQLGLSPALKIKAPDPRVTSEYRDDRGPALAKHSEVSGGTRLFADQAACPFRAFARHRLGVRKLDEPQAGLDSRLRGVVIHDVLRRVWLVIVSHRKLQLMADSEVMQVVSRAVTAALARLTADYGALRGSRLIELERKRLEQLMPGWLALEREREPFVVRDLEQQEKLALEGLVLTVQADRVDRLESGGDVVIDYKSGGCTISGWFAERLQDPQLPIYTMLVERPPDAILMAQLQSAEARFHGVAARDGIVPKIGGIERERRADGCRELSGLIERWRGSLSTLAAEIHSGVATVTPQSSVETCRYCGLDGLCRRFDVEEAK